MTIKKLYCFVDENGQDTEGRIFIVSVVVAGEQKDEALQISERIEKESGKGKFKWGKAQHKLRLKYLQRIFTNKLFKGSFVTQPFATQKITILQQLKV